MTSQNYLVTAHDGQHTTVNTINHEDAIERALCRLGYAHADFTFAGREDHEPIDFARANVIVDGKLVAQWTVEPGDHNTHRANVAATVLADGHIRLLCILNECDASRGADDVDALEGATVIAARALDLDVDDLTQRVWRHVGHYLYDPAIGRFVRHEVGVGFTVMTHASEGGE